MEFRIHREENKKKECTELSKDPRNKWWNQEEKERREDAKSTYVLTDQYTCLHIRHTAHTRSRMMTSQTGRLEWRKKEEEAKQRDQVQN